MEWIILAQIAMASLVIAIIITWLLYITGILQWIYNHLVAIIAIYLHLIIAMMIFFLYHATHDERADRIWWLQCFLMITMCCFLIIYFLLVLIGMNNFRRAVVHNHINVTEAGIQRLTA